MKRVKTNAYRVDDINYLSYKEAAAAEREELIACILADHQPFSMSDTCSVIQAHVKPFLNWHSMEEEQPNPGQTCFVCNETSDYISVAHWDGSTWTLDTRVGEFEFWAAQPAGPLS